MLIKTLCNCVTGKTSADPDVSRDVKPPGGKKVHRMHFSNQRVGDSVKSMRQESNIEGQRHGQTFHSTASTSRKGLEEKESNAVEDESNDSKKRLLPHKKNPGRKGKQGETKPSKLAGQAMKAAINFDLGGEQEYEDDDFNEEEVQDAPQDAEHEPNAAEEKSDERNRKPPGDQSVPDNTTQDVEQESYAVEETRLRPRKKNPSNGRKGKQGETKSSKLAGQAMKAAINFDLGGEQEYEDDDFNELHDAPQDVEEESNAVKEESDERNRKPPGDQSVPENTTQDVEQESSAVEETRLRPRKKYPFNGRKGKQGKTKSSKIGQAMKAATNFDLGGEQEYEDEDHQYYTKWLQGRS